MLSRKDIIDDDISTRFTYAAHDVRESGLAGRPRYGSRVGLHTANNWWTRTMRSRLNDQRTGSLVLIQQRCHAEDTTAVCLSIGGYTHLCLPEEFEPERKCKTSIW